MARREGQRRPESAAHGGKSWKPEALLGQFKEKRCFYGPQLGPGTQEV